MSQQTPYDLEEIAEKISSSFKIDHLTRSREQKTWAKWNIKTKEDFKKHIVSTLTDRETKAFHCINDRDIYYNAKTDTFIAVDLKNHKTNGTCYSPTAGSGAFDNNVRKENDVRHKLHLNHKEVETVKGGMDALYSTKDGKKYNSERRGFQNSKEEITDYDKRRKEFIENQLKVLQEKKKKEKGKNI